MERAGFGIRFAAFFLDSIFQWVLMYVGGLLLGIFLKVPAVPMGPAAAPAMPPEFLRYVLIRSLFNFLLFFLYFVWIPIRTNGQTIGKKIVRIRIQRVDGRRLTMWTLFLREFIGKAVLNAIFVIGCLLALGKQKRALHDYIAGTAVVWSNRETDKQDNRIPPF